MADSIFQSILDDEQSAQGRAAAAVGDDPDEASRALQLEAVTGVNAGAIYGDGGKFEQTLQRQTAQAVTANNPYIQDYMNRHSMHPKVSVGDLGNLDQLSQYWDNLSQVANRPWWEITSSAVHRGAREGLANIIDMIGEGNDSPMLKAWAQKYRDSTSAMYPMSADEQQTLWANMGGTLGGIILAAPAMEVGGPILGGGLAFGMMSAAEHAHQARVAGAERDKQDMATMAGFAEGATFGALPFKFLGNFSGGLIKQAVKSGVTFSALGELQSYVDSAIARNIYDPTAPKYQFDPQRAMASGFVGAMFGAGHRVFFGAGEKPPIGSSDPVNEAYKIQAKEGRDILNQLQNNPSLTKERSEEAFRAYLALHPDATVRITADGLRQVYGPDGRPAVGDGKLGDIPSMVSEFDTANATSDYASMPLKDWLTKVPEELRKDLMDDLILSQGGISVNQGKNLPKTKPLPTLERTDTEHQFDVKSEGKSLGSLSIEPDGDNLNATFSGEQLKGKALREVIRLLADEYPDAKTVQGLEPAKGDPKLKTVGKRLPLEGTDNPATAVNTIASMFGLDKINIEEPPAAPKRQLRPKEKPEKEAKEEGEAEGEVEGEEEAKAEPEPEPTIEERIAESTIQGAFTKRQWEKLQSKSAKEDEEKANFINRIIQRNIRKRRSEDWKKRALKIRDEVMKLIDQRPDVAADNLLRTGIMNRIKLDIIPKLHPDELTKEEINGIDPALVSERNGYSPDEVAAITGHDSGDALVKDLMAATEIRRQSGDGPAKWYRRVVDAVIEDRLQSEFGTDEKLLQDIQEHLISPTVMDRVHEEVVSLGMMVGEKAPQIQGKGLKEWARYKFNQATSEEATVRRWLDAAGRAGREAEEAYQDERWSDAYRAKQSQYLSLQFANFAKEIERAGARIEKTFGRFNSRDVKNFPKAHTNFIHDIMFKVGAAVKRSILDLQREIVASEYKSIGDFQQVRWNAGSPMEISWWLLDETEPRVDSWKKLTNERVLDLDKTLDHILADGRLDQKITTGVRATDKELEMAELTTELREAKDIIGEGREERLAGPRSQAARVMKLHTIFDRLSKGKVRGAFNRLFVLPGIEADGTKHRLWNEADADIRALRKEHEITDKYLEKKVNNDILLDNLTEQPITVRKRGVLRILSFMGNAEAWEKAARGWNVDPKVLEAWVRANTTKADWEFVQGLGKIFDKHMDYNDAMMRSQGFAPTQRIELRPLEAFGKAYDGWYAPMDYHSKYLWPPGKEPVMLPEDKAAQNALFDNNYRRAGGTPRWQKPRTGYARPTDMDIMSTLGTLGSMIRDTSYRPYLLQLAKFMYDPRFRTEFGRRYGQEFVNEFDPYMKSLVNQENRMPPNSSWARAVSEYLRTGLVGFEVLWKISTLVKHVSSLGVNSINDVGGARYAREVAQLYSKDERLGEQNSKFADENSNELPMRNRNWSRTLGVDDTFSQRTLRERMMMLGGKPMAIGDTLTAKPQWLAAYKDAMESLAKERPDQDPNKNHGQAVLEADRAVRKAHGSVGETYRPGILRSQNELTRWTTSLYTVYGHFLDRDYEIMWRSADEYHRAGGVISDAFTKKDISLLKDAYDNDEIKKIGGLIFSYMIWPTLIGAAVSGDLARKDESWTYKIISAGLGEAAGLVPGVRDFAHAALHGGDLQVGLFGTEYRLLTSGFKDIGKISRQGLTEKNVFNALVHFTQMAGALWQPGIFSDQAINLTKFLYNMHQSREPITPNRSPTDIVTSPFRPHTIPYGIIHGTAKEPRHH